VPLPEEKAAFEVEEKVDTQNTRGPTPLGMGEQRHSAASFLEATRNVRFVPGRPREPEKPLCVTRGPPRGESSLFASKSFGIRAVPWRELVPGRILRLSTADSKQGLAVCFPAVTAFPANLGPPAGKTGFAPQSGESRPKRSDFDPSTTLAT
jgi:hypothetical protein